jgi:monovalent cation:H+ antiporter-2, CPA2 family
MDVFPLLLVILVVSGLVLYLSSRLNLPSIVGFLLAGVLVGPSGIELIGTVDEVELMAEIGILLLMFSIGIEFSIEKLIAARRYVLIGGAVQVGLSVLVFFLAAFALNLGAKPALFVGMLFAMSSTAIVLQVFQEKGWTSTPFGKASISILIFQDIIIIPMMLIAPYLSEQPQGEGKSIFNLLLGVVFVVVVVFAARKLVPILVRKIVHTRNQELFLISVVIICFATAFVTQQLGLKLALGAFLAGLIISESEYSYEALKNIMPFKKVFTAIFFISVGMLLDLSFVYTNPFLLIGVTLLVMLVKLAIIAPLIYLLKTGIRSSLITGLSLCQVGEFAFILSKTGLDYEILNEFTYQAFLSISILSMLLSTLLVSYAPAIAAWITELPFWRGWMQRMQDKSFLPQDLELADHTVIIGFGPGGRRIARFLAQKNIPLAVIELNERNIQEDDYRVAQVVIGNADDEEVLKRAAIEGAKRIIITVPNVSIAEDIIVKIRRHNHLASIVVRTKYVQETERLLKLGATEVVPEELSVADSITAGMAG